VLARSDNRTIINTLVIFSISNCFGEKLVDQIAFIFRHYVHNKSYVFVVIPAVILLTWLSEEVS
jgi:hypothetical protein